VIFKIGDIVIMKSDEWPYLNESGTIESTYQNGDNKLTYVVMTTSGRPIGVHPELCEDYRPILREKKLKELGLD